MLWVSADPGCGKSVLARHLVDSVLPTPESRTVCYFFFKDGFQDQKRVVDALRCILHQLFTKRPALLSEAILRQFETGGETAKSSFHELWQILTQAAEDRNASEIICLLDAIDECEDQGSQLTAELCKFYGHGGTAQNSKLKFLLTSRPYDGISRGFQPLNVSGLPVIHLSGETGDEMEAISQEIGVFIEARVKDIGGRRRLTPDQQRDLLKQLKRVPNRTYLWVHLTLDLVERAILFNKTMPEIVSQLPKTVNKAYDTILSKSSDPELAVLILHIVTATARPLTLGEMRLALILQGSRQHDGPDPGSYSGPDPDRESAFGEEVRDICGLFVTVINSRIYLLHQTAREFLVQNPEKTLPPDDGESLRWRYSLQPQKSHHILAEVCTRYLLFENFETHPLGESEALPAYVERNILLDYSAKQWAAHLRNLPAETQKAMIEATLRICDTSSQRFLTWFRVYWTSITTDFPTGFTTLMATSYFGLEVAVKHLLRTDGGGNLDSLDDTHQRSALSWAAGNGFDVVTKLLIKGVRTAPMRFIQPFWRKSRVNSVDRYGRTPLSYAVWSGNTESIKLLVKESARVDLKDKIGGTPLSYAVCSGRPDVMKLLLTTGIKVGSVDEISNALLLSAAKNGHQDVIAMLLETGKVDPNTKDGDGMAALHLAAFGGHTPVMSLLLESSADIEAKDIHGCTPLTLAVRKSHKACVEILLEKNSDVNYEFFPVSLQNPKLRYYLTKLITNIIFFVIIEGK